MEGLTPKQQAFADYYIETGNATESYKRAGYEAKGKSVEAASSRLLGNVKVRQYIDERMGQKEKVRIASQDRVLEYLTQVLEGQIEEEIVSFGPDGPQRTTRKVSVRDRNKAAELLGKRYGTWVDKQVTEGHQTVQIIEDINPVGLDETVEVDE